MLVSISLIIGVLILVMILCYLAGYWMNAVIVLLVVIALALQPRLERWLRKRNRAE